MSSEDHVRDSSDQSADDLLKEARVDASANDNKSATGAPAWLISITVHALFALIFWAMVFAARQPEVELPPMKVTTIDPPPKKEEKKDLQRDVESKVDINIKEVAEVQAPVNNLKVLIEEKTTSEEETEVDQKKGREEAVADSEMGSSGAFMAIGAGGGGAGMFGSRTGGGKHRALAKGGGSRASESAVDAALRWFKRHQSPNGVWDVEKYPLNCAEMPKCEPGSTALSNGSDANIAMTGYALLCFLGAGYDHKIPSKYKATVQKGLDYLCNAQKSDKGGDPKTDGMMGKRNYENAIATMALAEAYAMTNDPDLKGPAQKGVKAILAHQNKDAQGDPNRQNKNAKSDPAYNGLGWDYIGPTNRNDSSVTGWNVMALKSALAGGLDIGNGMEGAKQWLDKAWKAANPDWAKINDPYAAISVFPYTYDDTTNKSDKDHLAPVGALCSVFLGHHAGDIMLESLCNYIMSRQIPATYPCNTYFMYYNTLAIFQAGGDRWTKWNNTVRDMLVNAQRKGDGCFDGSWNWEGTQFTGNDHGRILSTAYCCLCLEVYYRYKVVGAPEPGKQIQGPGL